jgi:hypothetical protein
VRRIQPASQLPSVLGHRGRQSWELDGHDEIILGLLLRPLGAIFVVFCFSDKKIRKCCGFAKVRAVIYPSCSGSVEIG